MKEIHILNGDSLKEQFPDSLKGEKIVARECLIDGPVSAENLDEFFSTRSKYLSSHYSEIELNYFEDVASEFKRIIHLPESSVINLWFEDDLFCQINLWFVCFLIHKHTEAKQVFLIRPNTDMQYGFGGLDEHGLIDAYNSRIELSHNDLELFASLLKMYQQNNHEEILRISKDHSQKFPFLTIAAKANLQRFPNDDSISRPKETLLKIMKELKTNEFGPIFREFHKRESIYGFGDLQVKRMFDELKS